MKIDKFFLLSLIAPVFTNALGTKASTSPLLGVDEIILINLKRRQDRLQLFKQRSHLTDDQFTRLEAFDGKLLRWNEELDKIFRDNTVLWHAPEIGCAMSHLSVWKRIASSNCKLCLVLEDDALFSDGWIDTWNHEYYPDLPQNKFASILYFFFFSF